MDYSDEDQSHGYDCYGDRGDEVSAVSLVYYVITCAFFIAALSVIGARSEHSTSVIACVALASAALSAFAGHIAHEGVLPEKLYYVGLGLQVVAISAGVVALVFYMFSR